MGVCWWRGSRSIRDHVDDKARWLDRALHTAVVRASDAHGLARADDWAPGQADVPPAALPQACDRLGRSRRSSRILAKAEDASPLSAAEIEMLFAARGADFDHVCATADRLRARAVGDTVAYVVNRNINYTNVCSYRCAFCAFSKGEVGRPSARPRLRSRPRRDRASGDGSLGARRHRGLPAGRHSPRLHRRHLSRDPAAR